jgi:hypothetical protein
MSSTIKSYLDFVVNGYYTIHAQGFNEPVTGQIIDIEISDADSQIFLVMKKNDSDTPVKIFIKAVTGWINNSKAA